MCGGEPVGRGPLIAAVLPLEGSQPVTEDVRRRVYEITKATVLGPFASPERCPTLVASGITHIFNVGEAPSVLDPADGPFAEVTSHPVVDLARIPDDLAITCVSTLHRMVCAPHSRIYVHCVAGRNRSPTILWLYLVACGVEPNAAKAGIVARSWDSVPGHSQLIDANLVEAVQSFGRQKFLPHPRLDALVFV
jgi:hypothetical protein